MRSRNLAQFCLCDAKSAAHERCSRKKFSCFAVRADVVRGSAALAVERRGTIAFMRASRANARSCATMWKPVAMPQMALSQMRATIAASAHELLQKKFCKVVDTCVKRD